MPELPEVETTKLGIQPFVCQRIIKDVIVRNGRLRYPIPETFGHLIGTRVLEVQRRAKYLIVVTEQHHLVIHLGMSGSLRITDNGSDFRKHDHVILEFDNDKALYYHDPRRFGFMLLYPKGVLPEYILRLAPEPLSPEFNKDYLYNLTKGRRRAIKTLIMDQKLVVGVGNIYANEALFMAKIHPECSGQALSQKKIEGLVVAIKAVLERAIIAGGTTLKDFINPDGNPGYFAQALLVYDRGGQRCSVCQTPISRKVLGQRATYWCPYCQKP